jgi:hypothetical protein
VAQDRVETAPLDAAHGKGVHGKFALNLARGHVADLQEARFTNYILKFFYKKNSEKNVSLAYFLIRLYKNPRTSEAWYSELLGLYN